jgi:putative phosphoesterase
MLTLRATVERLAVITDIHANLPALAAVLEAIEATDVDAVSCGGDLVGYGPHPNEVCAPIEERVIPSIYGNYDHAIARDLDDRGCAYRDRHERELGQRSVEWTLAHTGRRAKDFMRGLPFDLRFELGGRHVRLVHGSPRKVNEYPFENKPARTFERIAAAADCDVLVFGHTHQPWVREHGGVRSTAARSASPRTATPAPRSPYSSSTTSGWQQTSSAWSTTPRPWPASWRRRAWPASTRRSWY